MPHIYQSKGWSEVHVLQREVAVEECSYVCSSCKIALTGSTLCAKVDTN